VRRRRNQPSKPHSRKVVEKSGAAARVRRLEEDTKRVPHGSFLAYLNTPAYNVPAGSARRLDGLTEVYDTDDCFDPALGRYTPGRAGVVEIKVSATLDALGDQNLFRAALRINNNEYIQIDQQHSATSSRPLTVGGMVEVQVAAADYIEVFLNHTGGSGQPLRTGLLNSWISGSFKGEMP
jgi:hypothetical protein